MQIKELELGNLIRIHSLTDGSICTVEVNNFHLSEINTTIKYRYEPILVNDFYLKDFGFSEFYKNGIKGYINDSMDLLFHLESYQMYCYNIDGTTFRLSKCNYVHLLQNFYLKK